jgi:putative DNA primase/helicase
MPQTIARLALLFELISGGRTEVTSDHTKLAIAWAPYLISHAKRLYAAIIRSPYIGARLIFDRHSKLPNPFTSRQVVQKGWTGLNTTEAVNDALAILIDHGHVICREIREKSTGRPSTQYTWCNKI